MLISSNHLIQDLQEVSAAIELNERELEFDQAGLEALRFLVEDITRTLDRIERAA